MRTTEQYFCATVYYAEKSVDEIIVKCDPLRVTFFFAIMGIA